jgi:ribosomal protein S18 acetylase RimI-like enzyme
MQIVVYLSTSIKSLIKMELRYRKAKPSDMERCLDIREITRDNSVPRDFLHTIGVNSEIWCPLIQSEAFKGCVCEYKGVIIGFCFGEVKSAEILVLALHPEFENKGIGKELLLKVVETLKFSGAKKLWLATTSNPKLRAYGFYRYLGWSPTGTFVRNGDEILVLAEKK